MRVRAATEQSSESDCCGPSLNVPVTRRYAGSLNGKTELNKFFLATQYTCVEGDTWETVAREFGIEAEILRTFNEAVTLKAGSTIDLRGTDVPQLGAGGPSAA